MTGVASRGSCTSTISGGLSSFERGGRTAAPRESPVKCRRPLTPRARLIALLLMDVDGVLTDGRISLVGQEMEGKAFDVKDGGGLWLAPRRGLRTGGIRGRRGPRGARA